MRNKYLYDLNELSFDFNEDQIDIYYGDYYIDSIDNYSDIMEWLEQQGGALDPIEKYYLFNIVRPWRDRVNYIAKREEDNKEYIEIRVDTFTSIPLPVYRKGTMYRGMKLNKEYTLKELDIYDARDI